MLSRRFYSSQNSLQTYETCFATCKNRFCMFTGCFYTCKSLLWTCKQSFQIYKSSLQTSRSSSGIPPKLVQNVRVVVLCIRKLAVDIEGRFANRPYLLLLELAQLLQALLRPQGHGKLVVLASGLLPVFLCLLKLPLGLMQLGKAFQTFNYTLRVSYLFI